MSLYRFSKRQPSNGWTTKQVPVSSPHVRDPYSGPTLEFNAAEGGSLERFVQAFLDSLRLTPE